MALDAGTALTSAEDRATRVDLIETAAGLVEARNAPGGFVQVGGLWGVEPTETLP